MLLDVGNTASLANGLASTCTLFVALAVCSRTRPCGSTDPNMKLRFSCLPSSLHTVATLIAFRDANKAKGPGWQKGFGATTVRRPSAYRTPVNRTSFCYTNRSCQRAAGQTVLHNACESNDLSNEVTCTCSPPLNTGRSSIISRQLGFGMQTGGQYIPSDVELGGPWVCPTDPKYTNSTTGCDPCGSNRPNPYWGVPLSPLH